MPCDRLLLDKNCCPAELGLRTLRLDIDSFKEGPTFQEPSGDGKAQQPRATLLLLTVAGKQFDCNVIASCTWLLTAEC